MFNRKDNFISVKEVQILLEKEYDRGYDDGFKDALSLVGKKETDTYKVEDTKNTIYYEEDVDMVDYAFGEGDTFYESSKGTTTVCK